MRQTVLAQAIILLRLGIDLQLLPALMLLPILVVLHTMSPVQDTWLFIQEVAWLQPRNK